MARMGDWRDNKDEEIELDGVGGVNIIVKADVHRSGRWERCRGREQQAYTIQGSTFRATPSRTRQRQKALRRWPSGLGMASTAYPTMSSGISTPTRRAETYKRFTPSFLTRPTEKATSREAGPQRKPCFPGLLYDSPRRISKQNPSPSWGGQALGG